MQTISLDQVGVAGALDLDRTADGVVLRRLPAWCRHQITDIQLAAMVTMPAGVRLRLRTDSDELELDVALTLLQMAGQPADPAAFDLVVDGERRASVDRTEGTVIVYDRITGAATFEPGGPTTVRFDGIAGDGPATERTVEIWLPHDATVELRSLRVADGARVSAPPETRRRWIHHGSSISHGLEARRPTETWPAVTARLADVDLLDLAFAGQCLLDQVVARTIRDEPADLISLKVGINVVNGDAMRERTFVAALHGFLDTVRDGHPTTPLVLATPIICPVVEDHPGPTTLGADGWVHTTARSEALSVGALSLSRIRQLEAEVVAARRDAGDPNLHLLAGPDLFGERDVELLYDGLHPTGEGYRLIGERFFERAFAGDGAPFAAGG